MKPLRTYLPRKRDYSASALTYQGATSVAKLHRGDKITAVATDFEGAVVGVVRARVIHAHRGRVSARSVGWPESSRGILYWRHEGRAWARGWDTPDAKVLGAEIALLVSQ